MDRPAVRGRAAAGCIVVVTVAYIVMAVCHVSWTWDGSFLFYCIVEEGTLPIPHQRWTNALPMGLSWWASEHITDLDVLATIHAAGYLLLSWLALVCGLQVLPPRLFHLRIWVVLGVLMVPLPGVMCPTSEVTPCLQLVWPLLAWIWAGAPRRWLVPMVGIVALMLGLHPASGPALAIVAAVAWRHPPHDARSRRIAWAFTAVAIARTAWAVISMSDYEQAQLDMGTILVELGSVVALAPVALVGVVGAWALVVTRRGHHLDDAPGRVAVWLVVLLGGLWFFHDARWWSGSFNYRKFGLLALVPFAWLAATAARRPAPAVSSGASRWLWLPCSVFAILVCLGAISWERELRRLREVGDRAGVTVLDTTAIAGLVGTPLHHWSGTVTSILVQGRRPRWVLRSYGVCFEPDGVRLWPSQIGLWFHRDGEGRAPFDLSGLAPSSTSPLPGASSCPRSSS